MDAAENICKSCGNNFTGKYCNYCGEKIYDEKDKNVWHLLGQAFHFTTHFEGTFFNTLKAILTNPGKLSLDYCNGIRKKYFKPISFFLLLVVIYLLFPVFEGLNQRLNYYAENGLYGKYVIKKAKQVMENKNVTYAQLAEAFQNKAVNVSKFLFFILIPVLAFISWVPHFNKRRLFFDHFIFSIEEISFLVLWGFLLLPLIHILLKAAGADFIFFSDTIIAFYLLSLFIVHVFFAAKKFFFFKWYYSIFFALAYTVTLGFVFQYLYKFLLFVITINQI